MKEMIMIIIRIIITAVKPEDSSPVRMGMKRITSRQQGRLPERRAIRVTASRDQSWGRHSLRDPQDNICVSLNVSIKTLKTI